MKRERERITWATQFDGKNLQDIFDIPVVTSIRKYPKLHATLGLGLNPTMQRAYVGDWICQVERGYLAYWKVMTNDVCLRKQHRKQHP